MMSGTDDAITTMTYSSIAGLLILALVPFVWVTDLARHRLRHLIGVASTAGQWIVVLAFRYADASVLAPFSYTQLLWVSVLGYLIFGGVPDAYTIPARPSSSPPGFYHRPPRARRRSQLAVRASRRRTPDMPDD
jgi:drug/metabolite transporter (DMT)-like permease